MNDRANLTTMMMLLMGAFLAANTAAADERERHASHSHRWFSVPLELRGFPSETEYATITHEIDFSELLCELGVDGAVDERALRLYKIGAGDEEKAVPIQFRSFPQPRPERRRLFSDTRASVSYIGEYAPGETPKGIKVAGRLTWIADLNTQEFGEEKNSVQYRLEFGILAAGRLIQVPFPPQNLRGFDEKNRATPVYYFNRMQIRPQWPLDGAVQIYDGTELLTSFKTGPALGEGAAPGQFRRPFLYPVNGPDGYPLTEFGKPNDPTGSHAHHYSLWIAHANVNGEDFWSERGGKIFHEQFELMEDGPVYCRLIQKTPWAVRGEEILREQREWTFYAAETGFRVIDLDLEFGPASDEPVTLGKTSFGFLAARVAQSMTVFDGGGEILNSNGERNEQEAHLQRAAWIDQSGPVAPDKWAGVAIFDHPDNPNHPTVWHCRNDGWAGASFNADSSYSIDPNQKLRLRYRILLHQHDSVNGQVNKRFQEYVAHPVVVMGKPFIRTASGQR